MLILCPATLLNLVILTGFFLYLWGFQSIRPCHLQIDIILLLPLEFRCIFSFSCLIALLMTSSTILNISDKKGHYCLVPDFREEVLDFHR